MNYESFTIPQLKQMAQERRMGSMPSKKADIVARFHQYDRIQQKMAEERAAEEAMEAAHRATRMEGPPRQQTEIDVECLEYPFSFLRNGEYPRECKTIPGQPLEDIGDFPENIAHYYWVHPGENDEEPWLTLCKLTNDIYVFYKGECDYTGFDCQGHMELYASKDPNILLKYAMSSADYTKYVAETVAESA